MRENRDKYPVIQLTLKDVESLVSVTEKNPQGETDFFGAFRRMHEKIIAEYKRHNYLLESSQLSNSEKDSLEQILQQELLHFTAKTAEGIKQEKDKYVQETREIFSTSLQLLSELLHKHWGEQVIILIDK